jgi:hypothetical protein
MLPVLYILLHFFFCCISYWLYKSDTLFTFLVFLSPFYFSFITFKFFDLKKVVVAPGKYKAALISGSTFFLVLFLTVPLIKILPRKISGDDFSVIIPVLLSFVPVFIFNKVPLIKGIIFLTGLYLLCYYSILHQYFTIFLLFDRNTAYKGDTVILSFIAAYFICHELALLIFSFYNFWLSSRLVK